MIELLEQHRRETRDEFRQLGNALSELSRATSELASVTVRLEERHLRFDDTAKAIRHDVADHEERIRQLEAITTRALSTAQGGWKAITAIYGALSLLGYVLVAVLSKGAIL